MKGNARGVVSRSKPCVASYTSGQDELVRLWDAVALRFGDARSGRRKCTTRVRFDPTHLADAGGRPVGGPDGPRMDCRRADFLLHTAQLSGALRAGHVERRPGSARTSSDALPWIAGVAIAVKILSARWAMQTLCRHGEITTGMAVRTLLIWCAVVAALFGILVWRVPVGLVPTYGMALGVVLLIPVSQLAIAPLALGWNRHR